MSNNENSQLMDMAMDTHNQVAQLQANVNALTEKQRKFQRMLAEAETKRTKALSDKNLLDAVLQNALELKESSAIATAEITKANAQTQSLATDLKDLIDKLIYAAEMINKMVVADISHKQYPMHHEQILEGLNALDLNQIKSRGQADKALSNYISEMGVRQFLLKNLYWVEKGQLGWRINIPVLSEKIYDIIEEISFDTIDNITLFIRGGKSNYILDSDFDEIYRKYPKARIYTIEEAGHWVHAEAQEEFYTAVTEFLD
mgnify:CR=1 FL=1